MSWIDTFRSWLAGEPEVPPPLADVAPDPEVLRDLAARCRAVLVDRVVRFFLPASVDPRGGFLEDEDDGRFYSRGEKFLTLQARGLWFCSMLAGEGIAVEASRPAADGAFRLIRDAFLDREHGGYFAAVSDDGAPTDRRKHLYHEAFALFGLSRYAVLSGSDEARRAATDQYAIIATRACAQEKPGCEQIFTPDWWPVTSTGGRTYGWIPGARSLNGHMHLIEAVAQYLPLDATGEVKTWLAELMAYAIRFFRHPDHETMVEFRWPDGRVVDLKSNMKSSYGHDLEFAWQVLATSRLLGLPPEANAAWARGIADHARRFGVDRSYGGVYASGPFDGPATDLTKVWWVQVEALVAFLELYRLTGDPDWFSIFVHGFGFFEAKFLSPDGGCWESVDRAGRPLDRTRASMWKGPYHTGRAMALCGRMLEELAQAG